MMDGRSMELIVLSDVSKYTLKRGSNCIRRTRATFGRKRHSGAPLRRKEFDEIDLKAKDSQERI